MAEKGTNSIIDLYWELDEDKKAKMELLAVSLMNAQNIVAGEKAVAKEVKRNLPERQI